MDEKTEFNDDFFREIVKKGRRKMPNADFENQMILKLHEATEYKNEVSAKLALSLKFFVGGIGLGVFVLLLLLFGESIIESQHKTIVIVVLFVLGTIGILNIENYRRLIHQYSL